MTNGSTSGRTQLLLSLALLALLIVLIILQGAPTPARPYALDSAAPDGLLALRLWLTEMGYVVEETIAEAENGINDATGDERRDGAAPFTLSSTGRLLFIFPTAYPYTEAEAAAVAEWVTAGGTAVIMGTAHNDEALAERFQVRLGDSLPMLSRVTQQQPLLPAGPQGVDLTGDDPALDLSAAPAAVTLLATAEGDVTVAVQSLGEGYVWHWSSHHIPINARLREEGQAALIPPLLRNVPSGSTVQIDTYHLYGPPAAEPPIRNLQEWLYTTPLGWALLVLGGLTAVTLVLQGRRLGPPLPSQATARRREAAEYVIAMSNLQRRAHQRATVAQHHKRRLKRALSKGAHISADLDDASFLRQLAETTDAPTGLTDEPTIRHLFATLDQAKDERALVAAVADVDALLNKRGIKPNPR